MIYTTLPYTCVIQSCNPRLGFLIQAVWWARRVYNYRMQEISRNRVYSGHIFDVDQVKVSLPDQKQKTYELVEHPGAVVIVPVAEGEFWFVRQHRLGSHSELLEMPAGRLEPGELPDVCAHREIREETGCAAGNIIRLGGCYTAPGYCSEYLHIFLATDLHPDPLQPDPDEFIEIVKIPFDEAYAMAERGEMPDAKTLASLLLARPHLNPR